MPLRWILGLGAGQSADGVDAALLGLRGAGLEVQLVQMAGLHQPHAPELREQLLRATETGIESRSLGRLDRLLGETFASAARAVADSISLPLSRVQIIGCLGHALGHEPEGRFPSALTLGSTAVIAERTGVTVVGNFRDRDMAAGGQGFPLATLPDYVLFRHAEQARLLVHLGSVARVVYLPAACRLHEVMAFEAGPCNLLLDALVRHLTAGKESFDAGGKHAVQGRCIEPLAQAWLAHPALQRRPPRTLPRHAFGEVFAQQAVQQVRQHNGSLHDLLCTATHFVARGIMTAVRRFLPVDTRPDRVLLSGGGVRNGFLLHLLAQHLEGVTTSRTDEVGVPAEIRKPVAAGLLAGLMLDGVAGNSPGVTGAAGSRLLGNLTPGATSHWHRVLGWITQQAGGNPG